jgi:hypothetical protein
MDGTVRRSRTDAWRILVLFLALAAVSGGCSRARRPSSEELFRAADTGMDGWIDAGEFFDAPIDLEEDDRAAAFEKADADGDGMLSQKEFADALPGGNGLWWALGVFSVVSFVGSLLAIPVIVARLPEDYLASEKHGPRWRESNAKRRVWLVIKNVLGSLILIGGVLALFLPGQGILMVLLGLALVDIPGKWRLIRALARRPGVMKAMNWMRKRADKPPMLPPRPVAA